MKIHQLFFRRTLGLLTAAVICVGYPMAVNAQLEEIIVGLRGLVWV